jgi:hypothetical protein
MRYYDITIGSNQPAGGGNFSSNSLLHYTSHPSGPYAPPTPGALNVELDIYQFKGHIIGANSFIRIWGISPLDIGPASLFGGHPMVVQAGMGVGLPLANPSQAGLLVTGTAWQVFGNWQDVNLTLDIVAVLPTGVSPPTVPGLSPPIQNVVLHWPPNTQLSDAIKNALATAYPGYTVDINISGNLKKSSDGSHFASSWVDLSTQVHSDSIGIINNPDYYGVYITLEGTKFIVRDSGTGAASGNATAATKQILFQDMIGQPTWIKFNTIQFQTVMRSDIDVGDVVALPRAQFTSTPGGFVQGASSSSAFSDYRNASAFGGSFNVNNIHHVGNFRAPDGRQWCTVFEAVLIKANPPPGVTYAPTDISQPAGTA